MCRVSTLKDNGEWKELKDVYNGNILRTWEYPLVDKIFCGTRVWLIPILGICILNIQKLE